jgi:phosphoribosylaminoimidazole-succinocarboxamide synthase
MAAGVMLESEAMAGAEIAHQGKVRDIYELPNDRLLLVATDRVSAFDVVLPTGIPRKGEVLTRTSAYWFEHTAGVVPNHMVAVLDEDNARELRIDAGSEFFGRSMVVRRAEPLMIECVVRGYITGSGWSDYLASRSVSGIELPPGLQQCEILPEPLFTPSTKAEPPEHDAPMTYEQAEALFGPEVANALKVRSLALYRYAAAEAATKGILIADTKFEFGMLDGEVTLIDEALTPDSSRFWPADQYEAGRDQPSFDKQPLRDWLAASGWDKTEPGPALPDDVVRETSERYQQAHHRVTGQPLPPEAV